MTQWLKFPNKNTNISHPISWSAVRVTKLIDTVEKHSLVCRVAWSLLISPKYGYLEVSPFLTSPHFVLLKTGIQIDLNRLSTQHAQYFKGAKYIKMFIHPSWPDSWSSVRLIRLIAIFKSCLRLSTGLRSGPWLGHFQTLTCFDASKPFPCSSDSMFSVIVLPVHDPLPQSQVFCRLHHIFLKDCHSFGFIHLSFNIFIVQSQILLELEEQAVELHLHIN